MTGIAGSLARLLSCRDRAPDRDPPARGTQRLPARAGGEARARHRAAAHVLRGAPARPPCARAPWGHGPGAGLARSGRRDRRVDPPAAIRPRRGRRRGRRPPLVGPRALDRDVPVDGRGAGTDHRRGGARARRARRVAVANRPADRPPGTSRRAVVRADRRGADDAAAVAPRRGPADPDRVDQRDERQEHGHAADHPHPRSRRPAGGHDDVGRGPRRRAPRRCRRLDGSRWRGDGPRAERRPGRRARDGPWRDRPARRRLRIERRRAS